MSLLRNASMYIPPREMKKRNFDSFFILREEAKTARIIFSFPTKGHIIVNRYPNIMQFCCPEPDGHRAMSEHSFTFVLTNDQGERTYGFCTRCVSGEVYVILSKFAWIRVFSSLVYTYRANNADQKVIEDFYNCDIPDPGQPFPGTNVLRPHDNLCTFIDASPVDMLTLFSLDDLFTVIASLLMENHVAVVGPDFSIISRVCLSLLALIAPFEWQHVLIPVLPHELLEVLASPTPYLVGVLSSQIPQLERIAIDAITIVQLDDSGRRATVSVFPQDELPPRLPRTKFPSSFRMKLATMALNASRLSSRRLLQTFLEYYAELFGEVISGTFDEKLIAARYGAHHAAFFEGVFRTQQMDQLKIDAADKFASGRWADDPFILAAIAAKPAAFPGRAAAAGGGRGGGGGSSSTMMNFWRRFGTSCERTVSMARDDYSEHDCEMMERNRSLSRSVSVVRPSPTPMRNGSVSY